MAAIAKPLGLNNIWASRGVMSAPDLAKQLSGWVVETPPYQYDNWLQNKVTSFMAHTNQFGIPVWDNETTYNGNRSYTQGSDGLIYKALVDNTAVDPTNPTNRNTWVVAFDPYGAADAVSIALTSHLEDYRTLAGVSNTPAARANLSVYSKVESDQRFAAKAGSSTQTFSAAPATQADHVIVLSQLNALLGGATKTAKGVIQLATDQETAAGVNDDKAVTPATGKAAYLSKQANLADVPDKAAARANLGLGAASAEGLSAFLRPSRNLSDIENVGLARQNLGLSPLATLPTSAVLQPGNNLAEVPNKPLARANLGLGTAATVNVDAFLQRGANLTDLTNVAQARAALGLADTATMGAGNFLRTGNNLHDLPDRASARNALGLGSAALRNVVGFDGNIDFTFSHDGARGGWTRLPNGLILQWGMHNMSNSNSVEGPPEQWINFHIPFSAVCFQIQLTNYENYYNEGNVVRVRQKTLTQFLISNRGGNQYTEYMWFAIGI